MNRKTHIIHRQPCTPEPRGNLVEVFSGIQGEGIHVGRRHIFLRLGGCDLSCNFCDQMEAQRVPRKAALERTPGRRDFIFLPNPLSVEEVIKAIKRLCHGSQRYHALAITGGEPLLQKDFLIAFLPRVRVPNLAFLLETNGTRPKELRALLPHLDIVSMDFKLRSASGKPIPAQAHAEFLRLAVRHEVEVYVKAVVTSKTTATEIDRAARLIAKVKDAVPLVLQPITPAGSNLQRPPRPDQVLDLQARASRLLRDVRVIPQVHRIMGQR